MFNNRKCLTTQLEMALSAFVACSMFFMHHLLQISYLNNSRRLLKLYSSHTCQLCLCLQASLHPNWIQTQMLALHPFLLPSVSFIVSGFLELPSSNFCWQSTVKTNKNLPAVGCIQSIFSVLMDQQQMLQPCWYLFFCWNRVLSFCVSYPSEEVVFYWIISIPLHSRTEVFPLLTDGNRAPCLVKDVLVMTLSPASTGSNPEGLH